MQQLGRAVDRVMGEGSVYDRELAALAIQQAQGDLIEAAFLLRAYRTTLPRFAHSEPVETADMLVLRRISAIFKDLPGGQVLGPTYDYTHRLLDFAQQDAPPPPPEAPAQPQKGPPPFGILGREDPAEPDPPRPDEPPPTRRGGPPLRPPRPGRPWPPPPRHAPTSPPATSAASHFPSPPRATCACRRSPAATRGSCSRWATPPSAGGAAPTRS